MKALPHNPVFFFFFSSRRSAFYVLLSLGFPCLSCVIPSPVWFFKQAGPGFFLSQFGWAQLDLLQSRKSKHDRIFQTFFQLSRPHPLFSIWTGVASISFFSSFFVSCEFPCRELAVRSGPSALLYTSVFSDCFLGFCCLCSLTNRRCSFLMSPTFGVPPTLRGMDKLFIPATFFTTTTKALKRIPAVLGDFAPSCGCDLSNRNGSYF